jgi:hypothetical protein
VLPASLQPTYREHVNSDRLFSIGAVRQLKVVLLHCEAADVKPGLVRQSGIVVGFNLSFDFENPQTGTRITGAGKSQILIKQRQPV